MKRLLILAALLFVLPAHAEVAIHWVPVGNAGNAVDTEIMNDGTYGYGSVGHPYRISKYEVTNAQYAEFLNAVAATDTYGLYNAYMNLGMYPTYRGGITQSGVPGSYVYSAIAGREDMPVNFVSFYDALRFANWLHNGQPTGAQGNSTTEDGAYTVTPGGIAANSITRNADATIFLPSENEWYKAAYYAAVSTSYFDYPTGTDTVPTCEGPPGGTNSANCFPSGGDLTDVGSYTGSASPSGTFDQGGNVYEWNEAIVGSDRGLRGGSLNNITPVLEASYRTDIGPTKELGIVGFRVANWTPPVPSLSPVAIALLGGSLGGLGLLTLVIAARRRLN